MRQPFTLKNMAVLIGIAGICVTACQSSPKKGEAGAESESKSMSQNQQGMAGSQVKMAENVSDEEMASFMEANEKMRGMQQGTNQKMGKIINEEGLSPQRYNEIARAQNENNGKIDVSDEEMKKIRNINDKMRSVQKDMQEQSIDIIKGEGMTPERYQQVGMAVQSKPELQERYSEKMMEKQKQSGNVLPGQ